MARVHTALRTGLPETPHGAEGGCVWPGAVGPSGPPWTPLGLLGGMESGQVPVSQTRHLGGLSLSLVFPSGGDEAVAHVPDGPAPQQDCDARPRCRACFTGPSFPAGPPAEGLYSEPLVGPAHSGFFNCPLKSLLKKESFFPSFQKILKTTKNVNKSGKTVPLSFQCWDSGRRSHRDI